MAMLMTPSAVPPAGADQADMPGRVAAASVTAGTAHTCAILTDGRVRCWGSNSYGQLGLGHTDPVSVSNKPSALPTVSLGNGAVAVALAAGERHTCALLEGGSVRCWGDNLDGQLGLGHTRPVGDNEKPVDVDAVDLGGKAIAIAAGPAHNCAILEGGAVRCWGYNFSGQLGIGNKLPVGDNELPSQVGPVNLGGPATQVAAGGAQGLAHSCAVLQAGALRCWGSNNTGQLGYPALSNPAGDNEFPESVGDDEAPASAGPVRLPDPVTSVSAGAYHTCAMTVSSEVFCWGYNNYGQLGLGHTDVVGDNEYPHAVGAVYLRAPALGVAAGNYHTCALLQGGRVRCWGEDRTFGASGSIGDAEVGDDEVAGAAPEVETGGSVEAVAAGGQHTCAAFDDGTMRCWGNGGGGQLGSGRVELVKGAPALTPIVELGGYIRVGTTQPGPVDPVPGAPDTRIDAPVPARSGASVQFRYSSPSSDVVDYECLLDGVGPGNVVPCSGSAAGGSVQLSGLTTGEHTFAVKAIDSTGNVDASPATHTWTVQPTLSPRLRIAKVAWKGSRVTIAARAEAGVSGRLRVIWKARVNGKTVRSAKTATVDAGRARVIVKLRGRQLTARRAKVVLNLPATSRFAAATISKNIVRTDRGQ